MTVLAMILAGAEHPLARQHDETVLYGDMIIAHSLIEELGERHANAFLAKLEFPDLELATADSEALRRFLARLADQFGEDSPVARQLGALVVPVGDGCP